NAVMEVSGDAIRDGLLRDDHRSILRFPMALIHWVLFMCFHKIAVFVVHLLPEAPVALVRIHILQVSGAPALPSDYIKPISASTPWQLFPSVKFLLVLRSAAHA